MTLARVRRPICEARPAAPKASPSTYTPPWKYRTTWRGSIPSMVISAVGTPPSAAAVTVTSAGSGCADVNSRSSRRCSLTSMPAGKADCRRTASRFSRCSVLTADLPSVGVGLAALPGGLAHVNPLLKFPARRRATARLAARQVRRHHRITVIRATGAPQTRSSADSRECAGFGPGTGHADPVHRRRRPPRRLRPAYLAGRAGSGKPLCSHALAEWRWNCASYLMMRPPPERLAVNRCVELFVGVHDAGGRGVGEAGCHGGHGDAVGAKGDGQGTHDPDQRTLAGDIGEQRRGWRGPERVGGDEYDAAEAPFRHAGGERLDEPQSRFDIDGLDMAPGRSVDVADGHLVECCGAVDEHVAAPVALGHRGCGGPG